MYYIYLCSPRLGTLVANVLSNPKRERRIQKNTEVYYEILGKTRLQFPDGVSI